MSSNDFYLHDNSHVLLAAGEWHLLQRHARVGVVVSPVQPEQRALHQILQLHEAAQVAHVVGEVVQRARRPHAANTSVLTVFCNIHYDNLYF